MTLEEFLKERAELADYNLKAFGLTGDCMDRLRIVELFDALKDIAQRLEALEEKAK